MNKQHLLSICLYWLTLGCTGLWLTACAGLPGPDVQAVPVTSAFPEMATVNKVILGPGDTIDVKFRYWPELDSTQTIRPDGKISLQLIGHVEAGGLTPEELDERLVKLYEGKILDPVITTVVRTLADQQVYVGGEVLTPGLVPLQASMTVLEAVMAVGGFTRTAELTNVLVIRHVGHHRYVRSIDLQTALASSASEPLYLGPRDIIYVPRILIDRVNQWVEQYINRIIPSPILSYSVGAQ